MRTEIRKVVVEEEFYIATDGTEFDDEDDCRAYEVTKACENIKMLNYHGVKTNNVDNCQVVKLDNLDEIMSFIAVCKFEGISHRGIDAPGVYLYCEGSYGSDNEAWVNISKLVKSFDESEEITSGN